MTDTAAVASVIDNIAASALSYAMLLAAIGTLSMAFIEVLKGLTAMRRHFHRRQFTQWIKDEKCRAETIILAAGGEQYENVLFDQPIERMLGQIQAAANLSLEFPDRYPYAYAFFTKEDLEIKGMYSAKNILSDNKLWAGFASRTARDGFTDIKAKRYKQEIESRAAQQARVRLGNLIARRLDSFQNRTQYLWARGNQAASIITGSLLTAYVLTRSTTISGPENIVALSTLSLFAGMLAPFAKDVVSAIGGIRTKP